MTSLGWTYEPDELVPGWYHDNCPATKVVRPENEDPTVAYLDAEANRLECQDCDATLDLAAALDRIGAVLEEAQRLLEDIDPEAQAADTDSGLRHALDDVRMDAIRFSS